MMLNSNDQTAEQRGSREDEMREGDSPVAKQRLTLNHSSIESSPPPLQAQGSKSLLTYDSDWSIDSLLLFARRVCQLLGEQPAGEGEPMTRA